MNTKQVAVVTTEVGRTCVPCEVHGKTEETVERWAYNTTLHNQMTALTGMNNASAHHEPGVLLVIINSSLDPEICTTGN